MQKPVYPSSSIKIYYNSYSTSGIFAYFSLAHAVQPQVNTGWLHTTVGLKSNGTVVTVGWDGEGDGLLNVGSWTDIVQVVASRSHTVGLRSDGTVVAVGRNDYGQLDINGWKLKTNEEQIPGILICCLMKSKPGRPSLAG